ncbi:MAG: type III-B CRISPR module-associated protein Cmr5 [Saccharolobus sp.]|jgi:CRISPR type III-B/RAMP module-associated protein Cmr5|uniref:type III-B CRISPR module-associated protein Cmr5 n=1 Tax=Saccharolobus TaxID=2100760 RepID=UPI0007484CC5|nr:type III-B CRISPR module-associated protein Cmr5 [Saccharolobus sp.]KUO90983.1 MAG: hypothetical protein AT710_07785 [Thermocladium sp. ECH_B]MDT7862147.1 type III-B CRISPR module-associated protein Cmr5 [Saccharolobus sp.]
MLNDAIVSFSHEIIKSILSFNNNDINKSFRERCRTLLTNIYYNGIYYTFLYASARSKGLTFSLLSHVCEISLDSVIVNKEDVKPEEISYALYADYLVCLLYKLELIPHNTLQDKDELLKLLKENDLTFTKIAYEGAKIIKLLAEAMIK